MPRGRKAEVFQQLGAGSRSKLAVLVLVGALVVFGSTVTGIGIATAPAGANPVQDCNDLNKLIQRSETEIPIDQEQQDGWQARRSVFESDLHNATTDQEREAAKQGIDETTRYIKQLQRRIDHEELRVKLLYAQYLKEGCGDCIKPGPGTGPTAASLASAIERMSVSRKRSVCPPPTTPPAPIPPTPPSPTPPSLSPVTGSPYDPIGATYFGYDESQQPVTGSGFIPNELVTLSVDDNDVGTGTTDDNGNLAATITIPQEPDGSYTLTGTGEGGDQASADLWSGGSSFAYNVDASCDPDTDMWTVDTDWDGAGLDANATYSFAISTGDTFTAQTGSDGSFSTSFTEMNIQGGDTVTFEASGPYDGGTTDFGGVQSYGNFPDCSDSGGTGVA